MRGGESSGPFFVVVQNWFALILEKAILTMI